MFKLFHVLHIHETQAPFCVHGQIYVSSVSKLISLIDSFPDCHALWAKDGLEQLLQIVNWSKRQTSFPLKKGLLLQ